MKYILTLDLKWKTFSRVWLFTTLWMVACQDPLSMEFSMPGTEWAAIPCSRASSQPRIEPRSPTLQILYYLSHFGLVQIKILQVKSIINEHVGNNHSHMIFYFLFYLFIYLFILYYFYFFIFYYFILFLFIYFFPGGC